MNPKNIQIPYELFKRLLNVLNDLEVSNYDEPFKNEFKAVLQALKAKNESLDRRQAYSQLISASKSGDIDQQLDARLEYLKKKFQIDD